MAKLPVSRLIRTSVDLAPQPAQAQDLSTLLILGSSDVIDVVERRRTYPTLPSVAADFGVLAPEYKAAELWFGQSPQPTQVMIGRWAAIDTMGKLMCAPLSAANSLITAWSGIADGGFAVDINGVAQPVGPCDFSGVVNFNGVAAILQAATPGATVVYNSVYNRFEFTSNALGVGSTVGFLTTAGGTDISEMLGGVEGDGGYVADGIAAETALECAVIMDANFGRTWYATTIPEDTNPNDHIAVAGFIEGANNKHLYGVSTDDAGTISSVSTTDIGYLLKQLGHNRTLYQYNSAGLYAIASFLGRALTVNYGGQNTVITMMFKQEPGVVAEELTATQVDALEAKNGNIFAAYENDTAIVEPGKVVSGAFVDEITGTDWLSVAIQNEVYNLLYTSPTKIPQTDAGTHMLVTAIEGVLSQAVQNGLLAAGVWGSQGFGTLKTGDLMPKGFYVYVQPVALQNAADRAARKAPPIQIAAKLAGAIHSVDIAISVNR